jgi:hypothetical protein
LNRRELSESAKIRLVRELVKNQANGIKGVDAALAKVTKKLDFAAVYRDFCVATHLHDCAGGRHQYSFSPLVKRAFKKYQLSRVEPRKCFAGISGSVKGKVSMWSSAAYEFVLPQSSGRAQLQFSGQTVAAVRNNFWVAVIYTDSARRQVPEARWLRASANTLKAALNFPAGNFDRLLILVYNQGPVNYKDGDGRLPMAEFNLSLSPAKFSELHRER